MSEHISDELPRLLTGEATPDVVQQAAAHLRECVDCQQELVSAVAAHASLTSAQRFAPEVVAARPVSPAPAPAPLPDLAAVFAQVRAETAADEPALRTRRPVVAIAAAAAGLLIGGGAVAIVNHSSGSSPGGRTVALAAYGVGTTRATATITAGGRMSLDATSLPKLSATERYEVWLTNAPRTRMQPVGWVGANGTATLTVPANLMDTFSDIEVSVQRLNTSSYTYSGTSVLRGAYS
jgi:hypothetical protein